MGDRWQYWASGGLGMRDKGVGGGGREEKENEGKGTGRDAKRKEGDREQGLER